MKLCKQCNSGFEIIPSDLQFYDKVSPVFGGKKYPVPPPTLCPDCRKQRRLAWRNERTLYSRTCDATGEKIVSLYHPESPYTVYKNDYWWSDQWDGLQFGRNFDFGRPFFEQFKDLHLQAPRIALFNNFSENSDYSNHASRNKNCYLVFATFYCENVHYSLHCRRSRDLADCDTCIDQSELCYECFQCENGFNLLFSRYSKQCRDSAFLYDCANCSHCYRCSGLRNKQYCFENRQLTPDEYQMKIPDLSSARLLSEEKEKWIRYLKTIAHPPYHQNNCEDCTGDDLAGCRHCHHSFNMTQGENCKFIEMGEDMKDCYDCFGAGQPAELLYEIHGMLNGYQCMACNTSYNDSNLYYCDNCQNSKNLFGCVSLHNKEFCILNKQYSKAEYESLVPRIIEQMQKAGDWGQFFPAALSPFGYNESHAIEYYPLKKDEAIKSGFKWTELTPSIPKADRVIRADQLPDAIDEIPDDILSWAILCEATGKPFKITPQELVLYRKMRLPVPRRHPEQRHKDRLSLKNPRRLWHRACAKCGTAIQTTYAPDRPEKVYCEHCYLKKVY